LNTLDSDDGKAVSIVAENRENFDVTITLKVSMDHMQASATLPLTTTLPPLFNGPLLTIRPAGSGKAHFDYSFQWTIGALDSKHDELAIYDLPFHGTAKITQGYHGAYSHTGEFEYAVDWDMPIDTPIYAAREGTVVGLRASMEVGGPDRKFQNSANYILIRHPDGTIGSYDHLLKDGVVVQLNEKIGKGQLIGYSGLSGFTSGPHLHFFVFKANDGYTRQSFPIRVRTNSGVESLVEGRYYTSPGSDPASPPLAKRFVVGSLLACGLVDEKGPRECRSDFALRETDRVFVYLPIGKEGVYRLRASFAKADGSTPAIDIDLVTRDDWGFAYFWIVLSREKNPTGVWRASVYLDDHMEKSVEFTVSQ